MDIRKTGYAVHVRYMSAGGSVLNGTAKARGRKNGHAIFRKFADRPGTYQVELWHNGKLRLRSVKGSGGKMQDIEFE